MKKREGFTLVELLVVIGILGVLMAALFPAISGAIRSSNLTACAANGKKLADELRRVSMNREALNLGGVYPVSKDSESAGGDDISEKEPNTSEDYFNEFFDMSNINGSNWRPYCDKGFEMSVLWGFGVNGPRSGQKLKKDNLIWSIAKDMPSSAPDFLPLIVTRNVNCGQLRSAYTSTSTDTIGIGTAGSAKFDTPFGDQGAIIVTKGGATKKIENSREMVYSVIYTRTFTQVDEGADNPMTYLIPGGKETPKTN